MMYKKLLIFVLTVCSATQFVEGIIITDETRLHRDLFKTDKVMPMPVLDGVERKVKVTIGLTLNQVVDVEEANELVIINVFIRQLWNNPTMKWNPVEYGNVTQINVWPKQVWTPDLYLFANAEEDKNYNGFLDTLKTRITLYNDGRAKWLSPIMFRISCAINVAKFPFDTQKCKFKFGSFTYDSSRFELVAEKNSPDISQYTENVEWELIAMDASKRTTKRRCCKNSFDEVAFNLILKRKPLFLVINLLAPNMIFSFLTIVVYVIPAGTGERSSFVVSLVLAMALFLTSSINLMPDSSEVIPLFNYFLGLVLLSMFLLTITVCYSLSIYHANANISVMPLWIRKYILNRLAPYFGITPRPPRSRVTRKLNVEETQYLTTKVNEELECCHPGRLWTASNVSKNRGGLWDSRESNHNVVNRLKFSSKGDKKSIKKISKTLTTIIDSMERDEERAHRQAEWRVVSKALDKLCFWIFICAFLLVLTICSFKGASLA